MFNYFLCVHVQEFMEMLKRDVSRRVEEEGE